MQKLFHPGHNLLIEDAMPLTYTVWLVNFLSISPMLRTSAFFQPGCLVWSFALLLSGLLSAAPSLPAATPPPVVLTTSQKSADSLISKQEPPKIIPRVLEQITPENATILVSLSKQRAYLMLGDEIAIDTPISSGKKSRMTPKGNFKVMQKNKDHRSSIYGSFVDKKGRVVRSGISTRVDSAPSGTHYVGSPMLYFLRLTSDGVGFHVGILPGYPASHGCIRLPAEIAPIFYEKSKVGTPARIVE